VTAPFDAAASVGAAAPAPPAPVSAFTRGCAALSTAAMALAIAGLIALILCVQYQVVGRYVFNDTPTWAEALALLLVLYVTAFGVAVGVRDAGHIGLESLVALLPEAWRVKIEYLIHALVALFGGLMAQSGWRWASMKWGEKKPMLGVPEALDYLPIVICGVLIVLFSVEHIVALWRGTEVEPAWN
jgi:TRAP-type transport system small permease protein